MGNSDGALTHYRRQLTEAEIRPANTYIGPDDAATWEANKIYFATRFQDVDPPPTTFQAFDTRGSSIASDLATIPPNPVTFEIHDWDEALRTTLENWKYNRTAIRWFCPWQHAMAGKIAKVRRSRPLKNFLIVTMNVTSAFYYDVRDDQMALNTEPFIAQSKQTTDGRLYGPFMATP